MGKKVNLRQKSFTEFANCTTRTLGGAIRNGSASAPGKVVDFGSI